MTPKCWSDGKKVSGVRCQQCRRTQKKAGLIAKVTLKSESSWRIKFDKLPLTDLIVGAVCNRDGPGLASAENRGWKPLPPPINLSLKCIGHDEDHSIPYNKYPIAINNQLVLSQFGRYFFIHLGTLKVEFGYGVSGGSVKIGCSSPSCTW